MSMCQCSECGETMDSDFQLEVNELKDCICDNCFEEKAQECDCCGEDGVLRHTTYNGMDTSVCYTCSKGKEKKK